MPTLSMAAIHQTKRSRHSPPARHDAAPHDVAPAGLPTSSPVQEVLSPTEPADPVESGMEHGLGDPALLSRVKPLEKLHQLPAPSPSPSTSPESDEKKQTIPILQHGIQTTLTASGPPLPAFEDLTSLQVKEFFNNLLQFQEIQPISLP